MIELKIPITSTNVPYFEEALKCPFACKCVDRKQDGLRTVFTVRGSGPHQIFALGVDFAVRATSQEAVQKDLEDAGVSS